jgi:hypothetical protein
VLSLPLVRDFLTRYYDYAPEVSDEDCAQLGLLPLVSWAHHGQKITIYQRASMPGTRSAKFRTAPAVLSVMPKHEL